MTALVDMILSATWDASGTPEWIINGQFLYARWPFVGSSAPFLGSSALLWAGL